MRVGDVRIQGHSLKLPFYLLLISGSDLVLGADWLATLGSQIFHYKALTLKFFVEGNFITLHGDKPQLSTLAQYNHL